MNRSEKKAAIEHIQNMRDGNAKLAAQELIAKPSGTFTVSSMARKIGTTPNSFRATMGVLRKHGFQFSVISRNSSGAKYKITGFRAESHQESHTKISQLWGLALGRIAYP